jgi:LmbE family N-acetylglucosaminyl deacetylase
MSGILHSIISRLSVLACFAHPDDEGFAGETGRRLRPGYARLRHQRRC